MTHVAGRTGGSGVARSDEPGGAPRGVGRGGLLLLLGGGVLLLDLITKWMVTGSMALGQSIPVVGDVVRLTYIRNPGAAFGLHLGEYSRPFFIVVTLLALVFLGWMYARSPSVELLRRSALALLLAGAVGNLVDRLRWSEGVVDFMDVGLGDLRWPVFNVADSAITVGAILLAVALWQQEDEEEAESEAGSGAGGDSPGTPRDPPAGRHG